MVPQKFKRGKSKLLELVVTHHQSPEQAEYPGVRVSPHKEPRSHEILIVSEKMSKMLRCHNYYCIHCCMPEQ